MRKISKILTLVLAFAVMLCPLLTASAVDYDDSIYSSATLSADIAGEGKATLTLTVKTVEEINAIDFKINFSKGVTFNPETDTVAFGEASDDVLTKWSISTSYADGMLMVVAIDDEFLNCPVNYLTFDITFSVEDADDFELYLTKIYAVGVTAEDEVVPVFPCADTNSSGLIDLEVARIDCPNYFVNGFCEHNYRIEYVCDVVETDDYENPEVIQHLSTRKESYCTICGYTYTEYVQDYRYEVIEEPTCTKAGYSVYACEYCGFHVGGDYDIEPLGHNYVDGVCENCSQPKPTVTYTVDGTTLTISGEGTTGSYGKYFSNENGSLTELQAPWYEKVATNYGGYVCYDWECGFVIPDILKYDVVISNGITSIGSYILDGTLYEYFNYTGPDDYDHEHHTCYDADFNSITIPASVTYIDPEAFVNCDGLIIKGYSGTYAETYALENGYTFEALGRPELSFKSASLSLQSNLAFNFKVDSALFAAGAYENPYVVFNMNGKEVKVDTYTVDGDRYVFTLKGITPDKMKDTVTATLYATYEGVEYTAVKEYSIKEYCYNMLSQFAENTSLRTLIVDLLNYGAASQMYSGYNTDNLVNADLTAEQSSWGSTDVTLNDALNTKFKTIENATAYWKGAGITLLESVAMRLQFRADSIDGLTVNITTATGEWNITSEDFIRSGDYYYVMFDKLGADKMSEEVYMTVMKDDKAVSNTAKYSIESYAYAKQNDSDSNLANLVKAMMRYGNSAKNYNG